MELSIQPQKNQIFQTWKNMGALANSKRISAYLNRVNSGVDRGDDMASIRYVQKLFNDLIENPTDWDAIKRDMAAAKKIEDGE